MWQRKLRDAACEQLVVKQAAGVHRFTEVKHAEDKAIEAFHDIGTNLVKHLEAIMNL